jgi:hypothetical protein
MFDLKTIVTSAVTALVVAGLVMLVGGNQPGVGGESRFPNSSITAQGLTLSKTGTTTLETGKVCMEVTQTDGDVTYAFFNSLGTLATSSTSCL